MYCNPDTTYGLADKVIVDSRIRNIKRKMAAVLATRGPVTAIACLLGAAKFGEGLIYYALRNQAIDCADGSSTAKACALDIATFVISALITVGSVAGATAVGLTTPTPRDLHHTQPVFRVDGSDIDWSLGMMSHRFGMNRTIEQPAVVEYQYNSTSAVHRYLSYQDKEGNLVIRHPTGIMVPVAASKGLFSRFNPFYHRTLYEAYFDTVIYGDSLRQSELGYNPSVSSYADLAGSLFDYYADHGYDSGCVSLQANAGGWRGDFNFGASYEHSAPDAQNCANADYNILISTLGT